MADQNHHSRTISEFQARYGSFQSRFTCRNYTNSGFQTSLLVANPSRGFFVQAPSEREFVGTLGSNLFWASLSSALSKAIVDTVMHKTFTEEDREMMEQPKKPTKGMGIREHWSIRIQNLRSSTLSVIRYVPTPALNFVLKDYFKTLFDFNKDRDSHLVWFNFISGGGAGASTLILMHSLDLAWKRLAKDEAKKVRERQFTGLIDVYRKTLASNGIAGLYRGFNISCIGVVIYRSLYFGIYDSLKPVVLTGSLRDSYYATAALALLATSCASLASYPIDTVRSRMMMTSGEIVKYKSSLDAFTQIIKNEGAKSLFKSYRTALIPVMTAASVLAFYDRLQKPIVDAKRKKRLSDESEQVAI